MSEVVILSGSPSKDSRSETVLKHLGGLLERKGISVTHISVRDVLKDDLFEGRFDSPAIDEISALIHQSRGVIVGSPVYKAAYSGVLKALIDLLPQDVLQATPVLPLMTGGSSAHLLALEYTLKPLLANLKGQNLKGIYLVDSQIDKTNPHEPIIEAQVEQRLKKQLDYFLEIIERQPVTSA
ncbi:FMN reductase (NADPH) [Planococcus massiliensis]|uniref:FMN reductase (NADPH) n=1 Tax=Planococcus massiliensis TaxID=1499687 RepID=A0A098EIV1_9BACL|nr:NADPH-dependent FMN reductase [Planococcus massiliensis]CEG21737.1 FMN reductase (NADPH) [Planococcus massiliensis]